MADFEVIVGQNSKKKACSTNSSIFDVRCKKNQRKKFFIENLHAVVTYPLHYNSWGEQGRKKKAARSRRTGQIKDFAFADSSGF